MIVPFCGGRGSEAPGNAAAGALPDSGKKNTTGVAQSAHLLPPGRAPAPFWMRDLAAASRRQEKELKDGEGIGAGPGLSGLTRECTGRRVWAGMRGWVSHTGDTFSLVAHAGDEG